MKFEELFGKTVVAIESADIVGTINGIYIDKSTYYQAGISVAENNMQMLTYENISNREDFVVIGSKSLLSPLADCYKICMDARIITDKGKDLGRITYIDTSKKIIELCTSSQTIKAYKIISSSDNIIIIKSNKGYNQKLFLSPIQKSKPYKVLSPNNYAPDQKTTNEVIITDISTEYNFLLGRKVEKEISDLNHKFMIGKGTVITEQVLSTAKKAGKLVDLAINSTKKR